MRVGPQEAADILKRRSAAVEPAMREAVQEVLRLMKFRAIEYSGVQHWSTKELIEKGHPYSKKWRRSVVSVLGYKPEVINRQSGKLVNSWRTRRLSLSGNKISGQLTNNAPYWNSLRGREKQIERPIWVAIVREVRPDAKAIVQKHMREALAKK